MKNNVVGWFEIYVKDMERAKTFYQNVFKTGDWLDLSSKGIDMFAFARDDNLYGAPGALTKMDDWGPAEGGSIVYFVSEDCSIEEARILENGGTIHQSKTNIGEFGFITMFKDTEGNMIGIHSAK